MNNDLKILISDFQNFSPNLAESVVEYYEDYIPGFLILELNDGRFARYDFWGRTIRGIHMVNGKVTEEEFKRSFSERLNRIIQYRGLNSQTLAERIRVSRQTIYYYINGKCIPSIYILDLIADALDCPYEAFFFNDPRKRK